VGFLLSSSLTRLPSDLEAKNDRIQKQKVVTKGRAWTYLVTLSGGVIVRRPGNAVFKAGRRPAESAIPTAPEEVTEPLKISV